MKIHPVGACLSVCLFHADGQTHKYDEDNSRFSYFVNAPKRADIYRVGHEKVARVRSIA
jgi:hypothetical protein